MAVGLLPSLLILTSIALELLAANCEEAASEPQRIAYMICQSDCSNNRDDFIFKTNLLLTKSMSHKLLAKRKLVTKLIAAAAVQTGGNLSQHILHLSAGLLYIFFAPGEQWS